MTRAKAFLIGCLPLTVLAGCAQLPAVDATISEASQSAAFPELVPLGPLLATVDPMAQAPDVRGRARAPAGGDAQDLDDRARLLRLRAEALRAAPL